MSEKQFIISTLEYIQYLTGFIKEEQEELDKNKKALEDNEKDIRGARLAVDSVSARYDILMASQGINPSTLLDAMSYRSRISKLANDLESYYVKKRMLERTINGIQNSINQLELQMDEKIQLIGIDMEFEAISRRAKAKELKQQQ